MHELNAGVQQDIENWGWGKNSRAQSTRKFFAAAPLIQFAPAHLLGAHDLFAHPSSSPVETEQ